ncbi:hypothetical protein [Fusobacterium ulcerans]|uniref:hypothetical protein n=1 Tax=Fusobacterium ulcerans TaxID=861 RepID=UPI002E795A4B|nr:hypothetical protein [Fusobacterium ulcerans]MEE0138749.1 hypothetical protein [Fusobacterium ulcerans]
MKKKLAETTKVTKIIKVEVEYGIQKEDTLITKLKTTLKEENTIKKENEIE